MARVASTGGLSQEYRCAFPLMGLQQRALPYQEFVELMQREASTPRRNNACFPWGGGKAHPIERPLAHVIPGSRTPYEVGTSYTQPVGTASLLLVA